MEPDTRPSPRAGLRRKLVRFAGAGAASVALVFAIGVLWPFASLEPPRVAAVLAIERVSVVDVAGGGVAADRTVLIRDGTIASVSPADSVVVPPDAIRIDASGSFLIPGLWDMHTHLPVKASPQLHTPLFVAHGVTHIRELNDCPDPDDPVRACLEDKREWDRRVRVGEMVGPRIEAFGSFIVNDLHIPGTATTPGDSADLDALAARLVRYVGEERRFDFLKVYSRLGAGEFTALSRAAARAGLPLAGHRPHEVGAIDAAEAGMVGFEHQRLFTSECFAGREELRELSYFRGTFHDDMVRDHDPTLCEEIFAVLVERGSFYVPTHVMHRGYDYAHERDDMRDPRMRQLHWAQRVVWRRDDRRASDPRPQDVRPRVAHHDLSLALTGRAHAAGVRVLAGTDANETYAFPGSGLHEELVLLVEAGLSPGEALRSATLGPAEAMGLDDRFGTVERGKVADLVLLVDDPLADIGHTRGIEAVIFDGRLYDRNRLDELVAFVESQARSPSLTIKLFWRLLRRGSLDF